MYYVIKKSYSAYVLKFCYYYYYRYLIYISCYGFFENLSLSSKPVGNNLLTPMATDLSSPRSTYVCRHLELTHQPPTHRVPEQFSWEKKC
jgi:hypothetical protein